MQLDPYLDAIVTRLPDLALKTSALPHSMTLWTLPKNLFYLSTDSHPSECVVEIEQDIQRLSLLSRQSKQYAYLAVRVEQKIEVLVRLCQVEQKKKAENANSAQIMMRLCQRKEWVNDIEQTLAKLQLQHQHLQEKIARTSDSNTILSMQSDLGVLQKKITLLEEKLALV